MFQLSKQGKQFGIKWKTADLATQAKERYIKEHTQAYAGLVQREFMDSGMTILEVEAEDIARARLSNEIKIIVEEI